MHASIPGRRRPLSLASLLTPVAVLHLAALGPATIAGAQASAPGAAQAPPSAPATWESRSRTGEAAGRSVRSDLSSEAARRWLGVIVAAEAALDEFTGASSMPPRILPRREVLLFSDAADFRQVLATSFNETPTDTAPTTFTVGSRQVLAAVVSDPDDVAAGAADLLPAAGRQWLERWFQSDLPPAFDAGLSSFIGEALFIGDRPTFGRARAAMLIPAQVVARDREPSLFGLLALDEAAWSDLTPEERADGTLAIWSMLQFASEDDGANMRRGLRAYLRAINNGSLSADALRSTFSEADAANLQSQWRRWIERTIADPVTEAVPRIEALIAGLSELSAAGVAPKHLDEAVVELQARNFVWERVRWGEPLRFEITGPDVFELPEDTRTGRRPRIELDPGRVPISRPGAAAPTGPVAPPRIRVRGLARGTLEVDWKRQADGTYAATMTMRR